MRGKLDTWDFQWTFASFIQNGMNILANVNLASNIGHGVREEPTRRMPAVPTIICQQKL